MFVLGLSKVHVHLCKYGEKKRVALLITITTLTCDFTYLPVFSPTLFYLCVQVSYPLWRALMFAFWWVVIVYSMTVLIIIYTYQFEKFPGYWVSTTGWDNTT